MAAVAGLTFGLAMHPDYDRSLARSSPRQELHGPVFASGGDVSLPLGLSIIVERPAAERAPQALALAAPIRRAAPVEVAEIAPQDEAQTVEEPGQDDVEAVGDEPTAPPAAEDPAGPPAEDPPAADPAP